MATYCARILFRESARAKGVVEHRIGRAGQISFRKADSSAIAVSKANTSGQTWRRCEPMLPGSESHRNNGKLFDLLRMVQRHAIWKLVPPRSWPTRQKLANPSWSMTSTSSLAIARLL